MKANRIRVHVNSLEKTLRDLKKATFPTPRITIDEKDGSFFYLYIDSEDKTSEMRKDRWQIHKDGLWLYLKDIATKLDYKNAPTIELNNDMNDFYLLTFFY